MTITMAQIRCARGLLDWSQAELSRRTDISTTSIGNIESGNTQARESTLQVIRNVFERAGIDFIGMDGVRLQTEFMKTYTGVQGLSDFMDHVYETAKQFGGEIVLFNAYPENWIKLLGQDWMDMHSKRMSGLGNKISVKITSKPGETRFISKDFAEYRWFPKELFSDRCLYAYGDNIAFVNFEENNVSVTVLQQNDFAHAFRILFNIAWEHVAVSPKKEKSIEELSSQK